MQRLLEKYTFIDEIFHEDYNGYWVYLKEGYYIEQDLQTIHEDTLREVEEQLKQVYFVEVK